MQEFTKNIWSLFTPIVIAECITWLVAILLLCKKRTGAWRLFIVLFFVIVLAETSGWYVHKVLHKPNGWIFNINMLLTDGFLLWIFSTSEPLRKKQRPIYAAIILFIIIWIINFLVFQGSLGYLKYAETAGDIILVVVCCYFFYWLLAEGVYRNIFAYEFFWLANGVLVSSIGSTILYIFPELMGSYEKQTHIHLFGILNMILNLFLYSISVVAFINRNRNTR
jgi:hypothetical protein